MAPSASLDQIVPLALEFFQCPGEGLDTAAISVTPEAGGLFNDGFVERRGEFGRQKPRPELVEDAGLDAGLADRLPVRAGPGAVAGAAVSSLADDNIVRPQQPHLRRPESSFLARCAARAFPSEDAATLCAEAASRAWT